jgi:threonine synthase
MAFPHPVEVRGATQPDLARAILGPFVDTDLPQEALRTITEEAFNFPAPLVKLAEGLHVLELFHGPTGAFKDFGVRFMARVVARLRKDAELTVLTATSGDTGGAVAAAFHGVAGVKAAILYPQNKVTRLQEAQIASRGNNIIAVEIEGNFDDCQRIVKDLFAEVSFTQKHGLISANSINLARLLPQMVYYFWAYQQLGREVIFAVPSGNFGNLTAGLYAKRLGLNAKFLAVTNANDVVPRYLLEGKYCPGKFIETLTNAMDIADPSNFVRIRHLYEENFRALKADVAAVSLRDAETMDAMRFLHAEYGYVADPHTAIAFGGLAKSGCKGDAIVVATAHPQKFAPTVGLVTPDVPEHPLFGRLEGVELKKVRLPSSTECVKDYLSKIL